jgi:RNA polymerase sigma factor (sigma-70 family)
VTAARPSPDLPDHWFRHEFGRLVAALVRRFGARRVELCEDAVQAALLRAVEVWPQSGLPDDRSAWLYRVAHNRVLDGLRRDRRTAAAPDERTTEAEAEGHAVYLDREVTDDQLRLLFVCADPAIPHDSQVVLALKTLCGFSTEEIAARFFQREDAIHKRLQRARAALRAAAVAIDTPPLAELATRLPAVLHIVYLLFTEGHSSSQADAPIRRELCEEAIRLGELVADHPVAAAPEADALVALMVLTAARFDARLDDRGDLLLLAEQDRARWDGALIQRGLARLHRAARGDALSRYHLEAAISLEHCLAPSYGATRWDEITRLYRMLDAIAPSPLVTLNQAIALAEWQGADAGLELLEATPPPPWLQGYHLWDATLGELYRRRGDRARAASHLTRALAAAPTRAEKALLARRLAACSA